jgi:Mce-associated membrane protein
VSEPAFTEPADEQPVSRDRWKALAIALALALVVSLIALVVAVRHESSGGSSQASHALVLSEAAQGAEAAARTAVVALTTYDYATYGADYLRVERAGTAKFKKYYAQVSAPIRQLVVRLKAHAVGTVVASSATAKDADHVTVLMFVDQTLTNATNSDRKLDQPRVTVQMVLSGGRWLVDTVDLSNLTNS